MIFLAPFWFCLSSFFYLLSSGKLIVKIFFQKFRNFCLSLSYQCDDSAILSLSGWREVQICDVGIWYLTVSSPLMQVQILNAFSHSNARKALSCQRTDDTDCHNNLPTSEAVCTMAIGGSSIVLVDCSISCPSYHCYYELVHSNIEATGPSPWPVCIWYCPNGDSSLSIRLMGTNRSLLV